MDNKYRILLNDFIKLTTEQDSRNIFQKLEEKISIPGLPKEYVYFIENYNPSSVEVVFKDLNSIVFIPYEHLQSVQKEYALGNDYYVFASINGDPIVFNKQCVLRGLHGVGSWKYTYEAESFIEFIEKIVQNLKVCLTSE